MDDPNDGTWWLANHLLTAPTYGYLYRFLDKEGNILYIGQTVVLETRIRQHRKDSEGTHTPQQKSYARWWPQVHSLQAARIPLLYLDELEGELIHAAHPIGNRACPVASCTHYPNGGIVARKAIADLKRLSDKLAKSDACQRWAP